MKLNINGLVVELSEDGISNAGATKYDGKATMTDGTRLFIKAYGPAVKKEEASERVKPVKRGSSPTPVAGLDMGKIQELIAASIAAALAKKA